MGEIGESHEHSVNTKSDICFLIIFFSFVLNDSKCPQISRSEEFVLLL